MVHELKLSSEYFDSVRDGSKPFELRFDDRDYRVRDILILRETKNGEYTGRICWREITYKLSGYQGLLQGWCILGMRKIPYRAVKRAEEGVRDARDSKKAYLWRC